MNSSKAPPAIIKEDNMATIAIFKSFKPQSQRTKHINIRFFFLKDRQDRGEVEITYLKTEEMIADIMTKPLQGSLFAYLRSKLLNS